MAVRQIIEIDEERCTGCGECAAGCPEGALRIIDGKARMVGENLCDGLGACIGTCPEGAITITEREAEAYDEGRVMEGMIKLGPKVLVAHFDHLLHHGQDLYVRQALAWMRERGLTLPAEAEPLVAQMEAPRKPPRPAPAIKPLGSARTFEACPGSSPRQLSPAPSQSAPQSTPRPTESASALSSWPIQLHLINPRAPQFEGADLLVAADCTAFSLGGFHARLLEGRSLVIACPKLDEGREIYLEKLAALIDRARSVTVAIMEVPCCSGLLRLVMEARDAGSGQRPEINSVVLGIGGGILREGLS